MNYNHTAIAGRLTRDPESREVGEYNVCNFGIATNRKSGKKEEVLFMDVEAWGKTGEIIQEHFTKGSGILVDGYLKQESWDDKDGNKRTKIKLVANNFQFTDKKSDSDSDGESRSTSSSSGKKKSGGNRKPPMGDDDIPF